MKKKFLRRNVREYSKLGKLRRKLQKWRRPKGRDNKMRLKMASRPPVVSVGYIKESKVRNKIEGKVQTRVSNVNELNSIKKNEIAFLGRMGKRSKIEIAKIAKEKKIKIIGFNADKFLKENTKENKK